MKPNPVFEQRSDLYFPDGDVALAVRENPDVDEESTKYTVFRVHRFLLKHHSTIFSNLFADAEASESPSDNYDGVPLIEMYGDSAEDFALVLNYLYNPLSDSLVFRRHNPDTPLLVSSVIRLADKYLLEPLHRRLVEEVCKDWPTTLIEYEKKQAEIESVAALPLNAHLKYGGRLANVIPEPAAAIQFAQEFGCPQILPAAFYTLSLIPISRDWSASEYNAPLARWDLLDKENLVRYINGCQNLNHYRPPITYFMCEECEDPMSMELPVDNRCYRYIKRLFDVVWSDNGRSLTHGDPLRLLTKCYKFYDMPELSKEHLPDGICEDCEVRLSHQLFEERERVWTELSKWFKL